MTQQIELTLKPKSRGFNLVTSEIMSQLPDDTHYKRSFEHGDLARNLPL